MFQANIQRRDHENLGGSSSQASVGWKCFSEMERGQGSGDKIEGTRGLQKTLNIAAADFTYIVMIHINTICTKETKIHA